jgi:DNA-binding SARP family transcriptional activator
MPLDPPEFPVRLKLLGPPSLHLHDGCVLPLERKDAALLAMLALDGPTPRRSAAALLWPDVDERRAAGNLRERLSRLRRATGVDVIEPNAVLRLAAWVLHDLGAPARDPGAEPAGELLAGLDYSRTDSLDAWVTRARECRRLAQRERLAANAQRLENEGRIAEALVHASQLALDEPLFEHAHRRVMRLHYLRGDRGAALAAYDRLRSSLREQLATVPARETLALARTIEASGRLNDGMPAPQAVQMLRPPRLVGRAAPWAALEQAWNESRPVVVTGDAGIGKSRLLSDFADARQVTVRLQARPGDARVPYAVLSRLVRAVAPGCGSDLEPWVRAELARLAPELGTAPRAVAVPLRLAQACERLLAGVPALLLDDLHFADAATLEMLPALLAAPTRWLWGARSAEMPPALATWLGEPSASTPLRVELAPLAIEEVGMLLRSLDVPGLDDTHWPDTLTRHTGGNPLFVLETLRCLLPQSVAGRRTARLPVPERVGQILENRLARLSPAAIRLARTAAVAGPDFELVLAAEVLGVRAVDLTEPLNELDRAQLFRDGVFAHDLVQEACRRTLPAAVARQLHAAVATSLDGRAGIDARRAAHWEAAGEPARAAIAHAAAARAAYRASRRFEERDHLTRAAACHDAAGNAAAAFDARVQSVEVVLLIDSVAAGRQLAERLQRDARGSHDRVRSLVACLKVHSLGEPAEGAEAMAREALAEAMVLGDAELLADAARMCAVTLARLHRYEEALVPLGQAAAAAQRAGNPRQHLDVWSDEGFVLERLKRYEASAAALERAASLAEELQELTELFTMKSNLAGVRAKLAQLPRARAHARDAWQLARQLAHADSVHAAAAQMHFGLFECLGGCYAEGLPALEAAVASFERAGAHSVVPLAENHLAFIWMLLGQPARAMVLLAARHGQLDATTLARRLSLQGRLAAFCGTAPTAWAAALPKNGIDIHMQPAVDLELARLLPPDRAVVLCEDVLRRSEAASAWSVWMNARVLLVDRLLEMDPQRAAHEARSLLQDFTRLQPTDAYLPQVGWVACKALRAVGDHESADAALFAAIEWIEKEALPHVPPHFRDGFLHRNRVNAAIFEQVRPLRHG